MQRGQERRWQLHRRESGPTGMGRAFCALQAAAEPWVEAPRRICSFVLARLDGQHGEVDPGSARLGAAWRTGWRIWQCSATHHMGARRYAPAPTRHRQSACPRPRPRAARRHHLLVAPPQRPAAPALAIRIIRPSHADAAPHDPARHMRMRRPGVSPPPPSPPPPMRPPTHRMLAPPACFPASTP